MAVFIDNYTANQLDEVHLDEIQRLILCHHLSLNIAIDGPPGSGKTECILAISKLLNKSIRQYSCGRETNERQLINRISLIQKDGATITEVENGVVVEAAACGEPIYLDEFNLVHQDRQKKLNSLFDDRRSIVRTDGKEIQAKPGFWVSLSYNPQANSLFEGDLEESVADRFIHQSFKSPSADISAYIAANNSLKRVSIAREEDELTKILLGVPDNSISCRAIFYKDGEGYKFFKATSFDNDFELYDFFSGNKITLSDSIRNSKNLFLYQVHTKKSELEGVKVYDDQESFETLEGGVFITKLAGFCEELTNLGTYGCRKGHLKFSSKHIEKEFPPIKIHIPSLRIQTAVIRIYASLLAVKCSKRAAVQASIQILIDQVTYGNYKNEKIGQQNIKDFVSKLAIEYGFFEAPIKPSLGDSFNNLKSKIKRVVTRK